MLKCSNCGFDVESGMKFCSECGTALPMDKDCPKCHTICNPSAKFCSECGFDFSSGMSSGLSALSLGNKNVIAGDVIGYQKDYKISGNATIIHSKDESHKMVQCHKCGRNITVDGSFECSECHRVACHKCFDRVAGTCKACVDEKTSKKELIYKQTLVSVFEDGRVDLLERRNLKALQNELGLTTSRADELEKLVRADRTYGRSDDDSQLSTFEKFSFSRAQSMLVVEGNANNAVELLKPIFEAHPLNEEVVSMYLSALVVNDEIEAKRIISGLHADIMGAYISDIDISLRNGDMNTAEARLLSAESLWEGNPAVTIRRAWFYCKMFEFSTEASYITRAQKTLDLVDAGDDAVLRSLVHFIGNLISKANGDEVVETTKEFCKENNLSYFYANGFLI